MNIQKSFVVIVFTLGLGVGLYVANTNLSLISAVEAQSKLGKPLISPTEARDRDFYAPNSETLDPDEMRVIACGT